MGPAVVALIEVSRNTSEFQELVFLQVLGKGNCVKVVVCVNRFSERFVIFLFSEHLVEGLVHRLVVVGLDSTKVWLHEFKVT